MTVKLYDVEDQGLVLAFYDSKMIDILYGAEKWEKGRVLELLRQVSDRVPFDLLKLSGLTRAGSEGLSDLDSYEEMMEADMCRLDEQWGAAAMACPSAIKIDLTSAGRLSRYALGYDC